MKNEEGGNSVATVVLRGSTDSILDDLERAVDDGVNSYKVIWTIVYLLIFLRANINVSDCLLQSPFVRDMHWYVICMYGDL